MALFERLMSAPRPSARESSEPGSRQPLSVIRRLLADDPVLKGLGMSRGRVLVATRGMPIPDDGAFLVLGWDDAVRISSAAVHQTLTVSVHVARAGLECQSIADTPSVLLDRAMTVLIGLAIDGPRLLVRMTDRRFLSEEIDMRPKMVEIAVFDVRSSRGSTTCRGYPRSATDN
jgi:hypothetical protein